jgi:hypothetical protein
MRRKAMMTGVLTIALVGRLPLELDYREPSVSRTDDCDFNECAGSEPACRKRSDPRLTAEFLRLLQMI